MLTFKSSLVILTLSCISSAMSQNPFNITVKDLFEEPGDDILVRIPEIADRNIRNGPNSRGRNLISPARRTTSTTNKPKKPRQKRIPVMYWPSGTVPYSMGPNHADSMLDLILSAMREIELEVNGPGGICVLFVPRVNQKNYLQINTGPRSRCETYQGFLNVGQQNLTLGPDCEIKGIIMHELLHTLGFGHEHVRHDRDKYITINMKNVAQLDRRNFKKFLAADKMDAMNTSYDFGSIMHYHPYSLALNKAFPVITPKHAKHKGIRIGQRRALSQLDVIRVQRRYGCKEGISHIDRFTPDTLFSCNFTKGMCNLVNDRTDRTVKIPWTVMTGPSKDGPMAGHSNGADVYLIAIARAENGTARIRTPKLKARAVCATLYIFQTGAKSHLRVLISGRFGRLIIRDYVTNKRNEWFGTQISLTGAFLSEFQVEFEARLSSGDVAIDDINIKKGMCT